MRKSAIFMTLVVLCSIFCIGERGESTNTGEDLANLVKPTYEIKSKADSIREKNDSLFHHFFMSMAWIESRHTANITSDNNADGQRSHGWVQITPIFVAQANINRYRHETGKFTNKPKKYYFISDAYDIGKSKEMMYWVNKSYFDKYDKFNKTYDEWLWKKIMLVHNPKAKPKYRNDIIAIYREKVKDL